MPSVTEIGDTIAGLTIAQAVELKNYLKEKTAVSEGQPITLEAGKNIPTRKEAIGAIVAAMMGPAQAIAGCLVGPANNIAGILKAIEDKAPAAGGEAAAPAPAAG